MSQHLQNFVKFQKFQFENLVDFEKCCKTHIFLQKSEPMQPKTSNILPKFYQPTLSDVAAVRPSAARSVPPVSPRTSSMGGGPSWLSLSRKRQSSMGRKPRSSAFRRRAGTPFLAGTYIAKIQQNSDKFCNIL